MADLNAEWGSDLQVSATGDLLLAEGDDMIRQRIVRRLLTAVRGYVWHPEFGAGLPQRIGRADKAARIQAVVRAQIALDASVARLPVPRIQTTRDNNNPGLVAIRIDYASVATGQPMTLSFTV